MSPRNPPLAWLNVERIRTRTRRVCARNECELGGDRRGATLMGREARRVEAELPRKDDPPWGSQDEVALGRAVDRGAGGRGRRRPDRAPAAGGATAAAPQKMATATTGSDARVKRRNIRVIVAWI